MYTMIYIVFTCLLFMSPVYALPNSGPTLLPDHPSPVASTNLLEFLAAYEGGYSDKRQVSGERNNTGQHHVLLDLYILPVDIPAFSKDKRITALMREEIKFNGAVYRNELFEFIEEENEVIRVKRYNLTGNRPIKELQPEMLDTNPECDGLIAKVEPAVHVISLPDCRLNREGQESYPAFIGISTCSSLIIYTPVYAMETLRSSALPYIFEKTDSFPLPEYLFRDKYSDYTYDFVNPC